MEYRTGPAVPRAQTVSPKIDIEKADYGQRFTPINLRSVNLWSVNL